MVPRGPSDTPKAEANAGSLTTARVTWVGAGGEGGSGGFDGGVAVTGGLGAGVGLGDDAVLTCGSGERAYGAMCA